MFKNKNEIDYDLIILDLDVSDIKGEEVLSIIKSDLKLKSIPVVIMSSNSEVSPETVLRCLKEGAFKFVHKPVSL